MIEELHQNLQTFVARQFFVKIAVRLLSLGEIAKFPYGFVHGRNYKLGSECFRANLMYAG
jgi:hypothetical protein